MTVLLPTLGLVVMIITGLIYVVLIQRAWTKQLDLIIDQLQDDAGAGLAELESAYGVIRGKTAEIDALRSENAALRGHIAEMECHRGEFAIHDDDTVDYSETPGLDR